VRRLVPLVVVTFLAGCGQDVATCASDCELLDGSLETTVQAGKPTRPPTSGGGGGCASTCAADQAAATASGRAADFQAALTCVGNAGTFSPFCYSLLCGLTDAFGQVPGCPVDAGEASPTLSGGPSCYDSGGSCFADFEVIPSWCNLSTSLLCAPRYVCCAP